MPPKQAGDKRFGKPTKAPEQEDRGKPKAPVGETPELPFLRYGNGCNIFEFKEKFLSYGLRVYKELGLIFQTGEYWEPEELEPPDADELSEENDPYGFARATYLERLKARSRVLESRKNDRMSLFGVIWGNLSTESRDKIKEHHAWEEIDISKDPLDLWLVILETHLGNATGNAAQDKMRARTAYASLRQKNNESVADFHTRTLNAIQVMEAVEQVVPSEEDRSVDFLGRLDNLRYADLKKQLENNATLGIGGYPQTLTDAYNLAANYKMVTSSGGIANAAQHSVYFTDADKRKKKNPNGNRRDDHQKPDVSGGVPPKEPVKPKRKPPGDCKICGKGDHWMDDCPWLPQVKALVSGAKPEDVKVTLDESDDEVVDDPDDDVVFTLEATGSAPANVMASGSGSARLRPFDVLLDNQASVNLFRDDRLLADVRESDSAVRINGIGGSLRVTQVGDVRHFGKVFHHPEATANVLSFASIAKMYQVDYDRVRDIFAVAVTPTQIFEFKARGGLYICNMACLRTDAMINVQTVAENEAQFTQREVIEAQRARRLSKLLGYPSTKDTAKMLSNGSLLNCPITVQDVHRANKIYGPDVASLKGKTKTTKSAEAVVQYVPKPMVTEQVLHTDIMFVEGDPYLVSVSTPLGLVMGCHLSNSRNTTVIGKALNDQINAYRAEKFEPRTVLTDGEGGINAFASELNRQGIKVNPTGAGQHVPVVENKIRQIKERVRACLSALPYTLPSSLLIFLVYFCISRMNMMPSGTRVDSISPREGFLGRKLDYKIDLRVGFGEYLETTTPNTIKNSMTPRTESAIALQPIGNLQGSVKCLSLGTKGRITRDKFKILPTPQTVIDFMNKMAKEEGKVPKDPFFSMGNTGIFDQTVEDDGEGWDQPPTHDVLDRANSGADYDASASLDVQDADTMSSELNHRGDNAESTSADPETEGTGDTSNTAEKLRGENADTGSDPAEYASDGAAPQDADPPTPPVHRYPSRSTRSYGSKTGRWREREEVGLHISMGKALRKFGKLAITTATEEVQQIDDKNVWKPVLFRDLTPQQRRKIIRSSMFLKEKYLSSGDFDKLKARLVAGGNEQDKSLYDDISSPTVSLPSVFMVAGIAAKERRKVTSLDIGGAYLNADMEPHEVFVKLDPLMAAILVRLRPEYKKFLRPDGTMLVQLKKALYGCIESAKLWYEHITGTLERFGFKRNPMDICVFNYDADGKQCTICLYVDDLLITCVDQAVIDRVVSHLTETYKTLTVHDGLVHSYLGMTFDFSDPGKVKITMEGYIRDMLKLYDVTGIAATPATENLFVIRDHMPLLSAAKQVEFHSRVAKVLYPTKRVRPEMSPVVSFLTTRIDKATQDDWDKLDRGLRYINGTRELGIVIELFDPIAIEAFIDASHGVHADAKGHTGGCITLGKGPISTKSTKQKVVSKSSTEAELVGLSDYLSQVIWTRDFLIAQGHSIQAALVHQDNKSTIALAEKGRSTSERTRHINIRYFFIKDKIDSGEVKVQYLPTGEMLADILTKPLQGELFRRLRRLLLNWK
jgi:hypothetical protein